MILQQIHVAISLAMTSIPVYSDWLLAVQALVKFVVDVVEKKKEVPGHTWLHVQKFPGTHGCMSRRFLR